MFIDDKSKVYGAYFGILFFVLVLIGMYNKYVKKSEMLEVENDVIQIKNIILERSLEKVMKEYKKEGNETTE